MRKIYVAAYVDDDAERARARAALEQPTDFPAFVEGWTDDETVATLTAGGIGVVVLSSAEPKPEAVSRRSKRTDPLLRNLVARLESVKDPAPVLYSVLERTARRMLGTSSEDVYSIAVRGTLTEETRASLRSRGIELLSFRNGVYQTFLTPERRAWLERQPFVESISRYTLADTLHTALLALIAEGGTSGEERLYDLVLHRPRDAARVAAVLRRIAGGSRVVESSEHAIRFRARLPDALLATIADLPWVHSLMLVAPARLSSDVARTLIGLPPPAAAATFRWDGTGEIVAVIDSGIDRSHPDLEGQLAVPPVSFQGAPVDDRVGHGTHIAGIIAGTGAAARKSGSTPICGIAPGAKLVIVANVDVIGTEAVPKVPLDVEALFDLAVRGGASILNVSWGRGPTQATYDETAASIDRYVRKHPEVLVVVAAGNYGVAPNGTYEFYTLSTAATAKNALSVGASATSRTTFAEKWGKRSKAAFPIPAAHDEPVSGDANRVAGISSRGPTEFDSAKPDLVAPGTHILAPRAKTIDPNLLWSEHTTPDYVYFGGTSMAAPVVAGAAAVVRQYLRTERGVVQPSAALLKAVLISGATRLPSNRDATVAGSIGFPDLDQGFGRVDLTRLLPPGDPAMKRLQLAFEDVSSSAPDSLLTGTARSYSIVVSEAGPLVVTLSWTDVAGKGGVQNTLTLDVKQLPAGQPVFGNTTFVHARSKLSGASKADTRNNVHQVRIDAATPGEYVVRVTARTLLHPPQGYALVVLGHLKQETLKRLKSS